MYKANIQNITSKIPENSRFLTEQRQNVHNICFWCNFNLDNSQKEHVLGEIYTLYLQGKFEGKESTYINVAIKNKCKDLYNIENKSCVEYLNNEREKSGSQKPEENIDSHIIDIKTPVIIEETPCPADEEVGQVKRIMIEQVLNNMKNQNYREIIAGALEIAEKSDITNISNIMIANELGITESTVSRAFRQFRRTCDQSHIRF